mmetsp:Transcript_14723/g.17045  ORF Transcript_14723/g.17045 Transcript_14723/m.17045 type:complete len:84 (-) Transcript_14723:1409-1660(-)
MFTLPKYLRLKLRYNLEFDDKLSQFLLKSMRYSKYELDLFLSNKQSMEEFIEFLSKVERPSMLKFKTVSCRVTGDCSEAFKKI